MESTWVFIRVFVIQVSAFGEELITVFLYRGYKLKFLVLVESEDVSEITE